MKLGIDFGTCYSSAALLLDNIPTPIPAPLTPGYCLPSSVFITEQGEILIGQVAENNRQKNPQFYRQTIDFNKVVGTAEPKGRALNQKEIQKIIATCDGNSPLDIRDRAILGVLRGGGLRRGELVDLELADLDISTGKLIIRMAKGHKTRHVYIPSEALQFVKQWLELRGYQDGYLFCRIHRGGHLKMSQMHSDSIWRMLQKRAKLAQIQSCSPHDLRRTFCGDLLSAGVDIVTVQKLAGHASSITTASYDRRDDEIKRKAVQNLGF